MDRFATWADITGVASDALIYSTNAGLALTGGVGAALLRRYGGAVQTELQRVAAGKSSARGAVFETPVVGGPWKRVFHTVATDAANRTSPLTVQLILQQCLRRCVDAGDVATITCGALGTGYGDLSLTQFATIAERLCRAFDTTGLASFNVVLLEQAECEEFYAAAAKLGPWKMRQAEHGLRSGG